MKVLKYGRINDMFWGWTSLSKGNRAIYNMWEKMFYRCYNKEFLSENPNYKGCSVCDEWFYLSNFIKWIESQPSYTLFLESQKGYCIDKDTILDGNKLYCPEYCTLMTVSYNTKASHIHSPRVFKNPTPKKPIIGINIKDNSILLFKSLSDAKENGFNPSNIISCIKGRLKSSKGYKWFYLYLDDREG